MHPITAGEAGFERGTVIIIVFHFLVSSKKYMQPDVLYKFVPFLKSIFRTKSTAMNILLRVHLFKLFSWAPYFS